MEFNGVEEHCPPGKQSEIQSSMLTLYSYLLCLVQHQKAHHPALPDKQTQSFYTVDDEVADWNAPHEHVRGGQADI